MRSTNTSGDASEPTKSDQLALVLGAGMSSSFSKLCLHSITPTDAPKRKGVPGESEVVKFTAAQKVARDQARAGITRVNNQNVVVDEMPIDLQKIITDQIIRREQDTRSSLCQDLNRWCLANPVACTNDSMWELACNSAFGLAQFPHTNDASFMGDMDLRQAIADSYGGIVTWRRTFEVICVAIAEMQDWWPRQKYKATRVSGPIADWTQVQLDAALWDLGINRDPNIVIERESQVILLNRNAPLHMDRIHNDLFIGQAHPMNKFVILSILLKMCGAKVDRHKTRLQDSQRLFDSVGRHDIPWALFYMSKDTNRGVQPRSLVSASRLKQNGYPIGNMGFVDFTASVRGAGSEADGGGRNYEGWNSLHLASARYGNNTVMIDNLLTFGNAKLSIDDTCLKDGRTALMMAAYVGHSRNVLALINHGAYINAEGNKHEFGVDFALNEAIRQGKGHHQPNDRLTCVHLLINYGNESTVNAVSHERFAPRGLGPGIRRRPDYEHDPYIPMGKTPLMIAVSQLSALPGGGYPKINYSKHDLTGVIRALLYRNADPNNSNGGYTNRPIYALHEAINHYNAWGVAMLLAGKANTSLLSFGGAQGEPDKYAKMGIRPLLFAVQNDTQYCSVRGPVSAGAYDGNPFVFSLLKARANPDEMGLSDDKGHKVAALHEAVRLNKVQIVKALLGAGANFELGSDYGTPHEIALNEMQKSPTTTTIRVMDLILGARAGKAVTEAAKQLAKEAAANFPYKYKYKYNGLPTDDMITAINLYATKWLENSADNVKAEGLLEAVDKYKSACFLADPFNVFPLARY